MSARLIRVFAAAVAGALIVGCGGSGAATHTAALATTPGGAHAELTVTGTTSTPPVATNTSTTSQRGVTTPNATVLARAASACRSRIASQSKLSAPSKLALEGVCTAVAQKGTSSAQNADAAACRQLVQSTVPAADQQGALASCPQP
jgi:hypothetical protein